MYIDRPKLLKKIRKSILEHRITYLYGMNGVGKTTICNECLYKYFSDKKIHTIRTNSSDRFISTLEFQNGIYVFDDFNFSWDDRYIIDFIYKIPSDVDAKVIFISTERVLREREYIIDYYIKPFAEFIEINPFTQNETKDYLKKYFLMLHPYYEKIFNATQGNALLANEIGNFLLHQNIQSEDLNILYTPCIIDEYGKPINKIDDSTKIIVTEINDKLLSELSQNPELLHSLSSYNFERVIARMFEKQGFSVEITPRTRDGGKDIFIAKQGLASFLFYVECKKYAPNKPVGIDVIQRLYGVISAEKANGGFIATTSHFTKTAEDYVKEYNLEHQLTLQDYNTISDILKSLRYNTP